MICIIAGNYREAEVWARAQQLKKDEWFFPTDEQDLLSRATFHVVTVGTAGENVHPDYFERIYRLAKQRGSIAAK